MYTLLYNFLSSFCLYIYIHAYLTHFTQTAYVERVLCFFFIMYAPPQGSTTHQLDLWSWKNIQASFHLALFFPSYTANFSLLPHEPHRATSGDKWANWPTAKTNVCLCVWQRVRERQHVHKCVFVCLHFLYFGHPKQCLLQSVAIWLVLMVMRTEGVYTIMHMQFFMQIFSFIRISADSPSQTIRVPQQRVFSVVLHCAHADTDYPRWCFLFVFFSQWSACSKNSPKKRPSQWQIAGGDVLKASF